MTHQQKTLLIVIIIVIVAIIMIAILVVPSLSPTAFFIGWFESKPAPVSVAEIENSAISEPIQEASVKAVVLNIEVDPSGYDYQIDFDLAETSAQSVTYQFVSKITTQNEQNLLEIQPIEVDAQKLASISRSYDSEEEGGIITLIPNVIKDGKFATQPLETLNIEIKVAPKMRLLYSNMDGISEERQKDGSTIYRIHKENYFTSVLYLKFVEAPYDIVAERTIDSKEGKLIRFTDTITNRGDTTAANVSIYGFLPDASEFEILSDVESEIGIPEDWYVWNVTLVDSLEPGDSQSVSYQANISTEAGYFFPRVKVSVDDIMVALSNAPDMILPVSPPEPASLSRIEQNLQSTCGPNSCGACTNQNSCSDHYPNCNWDDGQCKPSCGNLGRIHGVAAQSLDNPDGNKKCSKPLGEAWDAELCCDGPLNEYDCFMADDWGGSSRGAQLIKELDNACQPGVSIDDAEFIDQHQCWLKMQAGWAIFDYVNIVGASHYTELTEDQYIEAILRFVNSNMFWIDEESNEDCLCGLKDWCFGSPGIYSCDNSYGDNYYVSYGWYDDWGCGYPEQARHIWARGTCDDCPEIYCGDCDDYAILRASLLRSAGFSSDCTWLANHPGHAFNTFKYDGAYRTVDYAALPKLTDPLPTDNVFNDYHCGFFSSNENPPCLARDWVWNYPVFEFYSPISKCTEPWTNTDTFNINVCGGAY